MLALVCCTRPGNANAFVAAPDHRYLQTRGNGPYAQRQHQRRGLSSLLRRTSGVELATSDLTIKLGAPSFASAVTITNRVIVKLAHKAAFATYGVVDLPARPIRKVARIFGGQPDDGIEVTIANGRANVDLHVVMERGINLAQVTANLQQQVRYQLAGVAGLPLGEVRVRVEDIVD